MVEESSSFLSLNSMDGTECIFHLMIEVSHTLQAAEFNKQLDFIYQLVALVSL
jgi:hypothetical protein